MACAMATGLSAFHRKIIYVLKWHFRKLPPKVISYRDFRNFENESFMNSLQPALDNQNDDYVKNADLFFNICHEIRNKHAARKKKYIRGNNKPKVIMQRNVSETNF